MTTEQPPSTGRSAAARICIGAVVALIAVVLLRWIVLTVLGTLRVILIVIAIVAAVFWAITAKANR
ncbi:MAG: hypothetical protein ACPHIC_05750 [Acidimicrobiales bacterium]